MRSLSRGWTTRSCTATVGMPFISGAPRRAAVQRQRTRRTRCRRTSSRGFLASAVQHVHRMLGRERLADVGPGRAVVRGLEDPGAEVVAAVAVEADERRAGRVGRRLDVAHPQLGGHAGHRAVDLRPGRRRRSSSPTRCRRRCRPRRGPATRGDSDSETIVACVSAPVESGVRPPVSSRVVSGSLFDRSALMIRHVAPPSTDLKRRLPPK